MMPFDGQIILSVWRVWYGRITVGDSRGNESEFGQACEKNQKEAQDFAGKAQ